MFFFISVSNDIWDECIIIVLVRWTWMCSFIFEIQSSKKSSYELAKLLKAYENSILVKLIMLCALKNC